MIMYGAIYAQSPPSSSVFLPTMHLTCWLYCDDIGFTTGHISCSQMPLIFFLTSEANIMILCCGTQNLYKTN